MQQLPLKIIVTESACIRRIKNLESRGNIAALHSSALQGLFIP